MHIFLGRRFKPFGCKLGLRGLSVQCTMAGMTLKTFLALPGNTSVSLARRLGVSHTTVLRWAAGQVPPDRLYDLYAATGIHPADLRPDLASLLLPKSQRRADRATHNPEAASEPAP